MAIYGWNFNSTPIPATLKSRFAETKRIIPKGLTNHPKVTARLVGVCESEQERDVMLIQAYNGTRKLHVETRQTAKGTLYGIYVYHD